ncbi:reverse transcriptase domain-containing protein [Tanacetum coccineum]
MLQHYKDAHLVFNWEKCHFMVKEGIVLGHKVSEAGLEVDKSKINVISKLPPLLISKIIKRETHMFSCDHKPDWSLPFKLRCDASNFSVGVVLGQKDEFDIEIKDRKGTENVVADHLSRIENEEISDDSEVDDNFLGETLMKINTRDEPWFANFANYLEEPYLFKVLDSEFYWPTIIKEAYTLVRLFEARQKTGNILKRDEMPLNNIQKPFCHFEMPKALISDRGTHFCNKIMERTLKRYGVNHRFSTSYHPQTSGQVENTNKALKRILENTVKDNPAIWSRKLNDALWAFCTSYKTPTGTTPYKLIYGKNCHLPHEIEHRAYKALKNYNPDLIAAGDTPFFPKE